MSGNTIDIKNPLLSIRQITILYQHLEASDFICLIFLWDVWYNNLAKYEW